MSSSTMSSWITWTTRSSLQIGQVSGDISSPSRWTRWSILYSNTFFLSEFTARHWKHWNSLCVWDTIPKHRQCHSAELHQVREEGKNFYDFFCHLGMWNMTLSSGSIWTPRSIWYWQSDTVHINFLLQAPYLEKKFKKIYEGNAYKYKN